MKRLTTTFILLSITSTMAFANPEKAAVNSQTCHLVKNTTSPFILVLKAGENLIDGITACAQDANLKSALVSGLGQVQNPTLAYFSSDPNEKPNLSTLTGYYELVSLTGNITNNNKKYYTHVHAALANENFNALAGHVNNAIVGLTAEIIITPLKAVVMRDVDEKTGFGLIKTMNK